jgi:cyclic pyranopterin phosphate synthase
MPERPTFSKAKTWLGADELKKIVGALHRRGVDELRLTGGEPLLRKDFLELARGLSKLSWKKMGLTTNGEGLAPMVSDLKDQTAIDSINISLDSLDPQKFRSITGRGHLEKVLDGIHGALNAGFPIKINMVVMAGINDHEVEDFVHFGASSGVEVRFLEIMRVGPNEEDFSKLLIPSARLRRRLERNFDLRARVAPLDNTATEYVTDKGVKLGFISSETESFCGQCSRLRLTASGELRSCLFRDDGISLRGLDDDAFDHAVKQVVDMKPMERITSIQQPMYAIGG